MTMRFRSRVVATVLPYLLLSACAVGPPYHPTSAKRATVTVDLNAYPSEHGQLLIHPKGAMVGATCSADGQETIAILRNQGHDRSHADQGHDANSVTFDVDATGRPFRLLGLSNRYELEGRMLHATICEPNVEFVPLPGEHYRAEFNTRQGSCELVVKMWSGAIAHGFKRLPECYISGQQGGWLSRTAEDRMSKDPRAYEEAAREQY